MLLFNRLLCNMCLLSVPRCCLTAYAAILCLLIDFVCWLEFAFAAYNFILFCICLCCCFRCFFFLIHLSAREIVMFSGNIFFFHFSAMAHDRNIIFFVRVRALHHYNTASVCIVDWAQDGKIAHISTEINTLKCVSVSAVMMWNYQRWNGRKKERGRRFYVDPLSFDYSKLLGFFFFVPLSLAHLLIYGIWNLPICKYIVRLF